MYQKVTINKLYNDLEVNLLNHCGWMIVVKTMKNNNKFWNGVYLACAFFFFLILFMQTLLDYYGCKVELQWKKWKSGLILHWMWKFQMPKPILNTNDWSSQVSYSSQENRKSQVSYCLAFLPVKHLGV